MSKTVNELKTVIQRITLGGNAEARKRHTSKNKLLVRDRVDKLVDPKFVIYSFATFVFYWTHLVLHFWNCHN